MNTKRHFLVGGGWALLATLGTANGALKSVLPPVEPARVARVVDADTYDVVTGGQRVRVRLRGVDAPEHDQAFGAQATDSVAALLPVGRRVQLRRHGVDRYGRTLGSLVLPPASGTAGRGALDSLLVVHGWAWAYDPAHKVAGRAAQQAQAQAAGRGLWKCGVAAAVPPQLWRTFNYQNKRRYGAGCSW